MPLHLTFDDGPDPVWTPRVLETLLRHEATATFFVLGWRVREQPALVAELLAAGQRVELHGDAHLDHELAEPEAVAADTRAALQALRGVGVEPQWWRLPFGRIGPSTRSLARAHGLRLVGWHADTHDWRGDGWAHQPAQVSDAAALGGVVLLHDAIVPGIGRTGAENTLELTDRLLRAAGRAGTPALALPDARFDDGSPRDTATDAIPEAPRPSPFERHEASLRAFRHADRLRAGDRSLQPGYLNQPDGR